MEHALPHPALAARPHRRPRRAAATGAARAGTGLPPRRLLALLALYGCWGSSIPAMAIMVRAVPPLAGAGAVFLAGGIALLAFARPARGSVGRAAAGRASLAGVLLLVGGQGLATVALTQLTASLTAIIAATVPLAVALLGALTGRRLSRATVAWLVVGFAGVALATLTAPAAALGGSAAGLLVIACAVVLWASGSVYGSRRELPADGRVSAGVQLIAGGSVLLVLAAITGQLGAGPWADVDLGSVAAAGSLLVFDSVLGYWLYAHLLRTAAIELVSTYSYATPLMGTTLGFLALSEPFWGGALVGGALVVAAVAGQLRSTAARR